MIRFSNTLTGRVEEFVPMEAGKVRMYTCGPTVYDVAHIGNFRTYVWEDVLRRFLKSQGLEVTQIMNLTDVDDKSIRGAVERGVSLDAYTAPYIQAFFEDLDALGIERAEVYPRATHHIPEMVVLIKRLMANGHTYESGGSIYFRISTFEPYGRLAKLRPEALMTGARVESDEYEKEEARDFALWKSVKPGEPFWDTELGPGRPGWHIECSAMSMKYLGESFDIHTGGVDNIFPHHENEIAQSEAATGKPFVKFWLHSEWLLVEREKMSKSKGNFYTLRDLLAKGIDPKVLRYLLVSIHYKKQLNYGEEALQHATGALERLKNFLRRLRQERFADGSNADLAREIESGRTGFWDAMRDDLNTSAALGAIHTLVTHANTAMDSAAIGRDDASRIEAVLREANQVLNVLDLEGEETVDAGTEALIREREEARKRRDWAMSDRLRDQILERGYVVEDTKEGPRWKKR